MINVFGRLLEAFIFLQPSHQIGTRIGLLGDRVARAWQQHAGFNFREGGRHDQIFARQLELHILHQLDVVHVLARDVGQWNIQNIEILFANQIQEQIERPLECFKEYLECLRRDIKIPR